MTVRVFLLLIIVSACTGVLAADIDHARLDAVRARAEARTATLHGPQYDALLGKAAGPTARLLQDPRLGLMGVTASGRPLFYTTHNLDAAATVSTNLVWPGGTASLGLTGANQSGDLAIWDGGIVLVSHQEFDGRVTVADGGTSVHPHATHVAGTMVAAGLDPQARGMSPEALLDSYDWGDDEAEMATAAGQGLRLSNHSYGWVVGWLYGFNNDDEWYWFGDTSVSETEDPGFGFYATGTAEWDEIANAAPRYLIVKSAGNDRNDDGPGAGGGHYVWDQSAGDWAWSTVTRDGDGGDDGFDSIGYRGNAKNILTVGAVDDIPGGWTSPADVQATSFTGWGPTDDGRIKPDLVANGVSLYSSLSGSDTDYGRYSGTSMSAPSTTGSLNLLAQQYAALHDGEAPLASLLKAVVLHTCDEAGPAPGPDYMFGWGLLNTAEAALLIADDAAGGARTIVADLQPGTVDPYLVQHDGTGPLKITLVWNDPAGEAPAWSLDPDTPMLVHDLDLRLIRESDGATFRPWTLDPAAPAAAAATGENHRDNVEVLEVAGAEAGIYRIEVSHTGTVTGSQEYALVRTGLEPVSMTAAGDTPTTAARLVHAAPNPFNPRTEIAFDLERDQTVDLEVFDARGRRIAVLATGSLAAGRHRVAWDGRSGDGRAAAAGIYLVRLRAGGVEDQLRLTLVK